MAGLLDLINKNRAKKFADGGMVLPYGQKLGQAQDTVERAAAAAGGAYSTVPPPPARLAPNAATFVPPGSVTPEQAEVDSRGQVPRLLEAGMLDVSSGLSNAMAATAQALGSDNIAEAQRRSAQQDAERAAKITPDMIGDIDEINGPKGGVGTYIGQHAIRALPTLGTMALGGVFAAGARAPAVLGVAAPSAALNTGEAYAKLHAAAKTPEQRDQAPAYALAAGGINAILDTLGFGFAAKLSPVAKIALARTLPAHLLQSAAAEGGTGAAQEYVNIVATKHMLDNPDLFGLTPQDTHDLLNAAASEASGIAPISVGGHLAHGAGSVMGRAATKAGEAIGNFRNRGAEDEGEVIPPNDGGPPPPAGPTFTQRAGDAAGAAFRGDFAPAQELGGEVLSSARENIPGVDTAIDKGTEFYQRAKAAAKPGVDEFVQKTKDSFDPLVAEELARRTGNAVRSTAATFEEKARASKDLVKQMWAAAQKTEDPNVKKSGFRGKVSPEQEALFKSFKELSPFTSDDDNRFAAKVVDSLIGDNKRFDAWLAQPGMIHVMREQYGMTPEEFKKHVLVTAREQTPDNGRPARGGYDITDSSHLFEDNALEGNDAHRGRAIMSPDLVDMLNEHGTLNDSGARNPHMNAERFTQFLATKRDTREGRGAGSQVRVAITRTPRDPETGEPTGEPETAMHLVNLMNLAKAWGVNQREMGVMDKERGESTEKRDRLNVVDGVAAMLGGWEETSREKDPKTGKFTKYTVDVRPVKIGEGDKPYSPDFDKWLPPDAVVGFADGKQVTWGEMQERAKANAPVGAASAIDSHFSKVGQQRANQMARGDKFLDRKFGSAVTEHYDSKEAHDAARLEFGRSKAEKQREALAKLDGTTYLSDADLARSAGADRAVRSIVNDVLGGPDGVLSTMEPEARGRAVEASQKFIEDNPKTPFTDAVHEMLHITDPDSVNWVPELARDEMKTGLERMARAGDKEAFREAVDETDQQATMFDRKPSPELRRSMREHVQEDPLNKELSAEYAGLMLRSVYQELIPHVAKGVIPAIALLPSEIRYSGRAELVAQLGRLELRTGHDNLSEQEQSVDSPTYNDDNKKPETPPYQDYGGMQRAGIRQRRATQLHEDAYAKLEEIYNRPGIPEITKQNALKVRDMLGSLPDKALRTIMDDKFNASDLGKIINAPKFKVDRAAPNARNKFGEFGEEKQDPTLTPFVGPEKPFNHRLVERDAQYRMHLSKKEQALKNRLTTGEETDKRNYRQGEDGETTPSKAEEVPFEKKAQFHEPRSLEPRETVLSGAGANRMDLGAGPGRVMKNLSDAAEILMPGAAAERAKAQQMLKSGVKARREEAAAKIAKMDHRLRALLEERGYKEVSDGSWAPSTKKLEDFPKKAEPGEGPANGGTIRKSEYRGSKQAGGYFAEQIHPEEVRSERAGLHPSQRPEAGEYWIVKDRNGERQQDERGHELLGWMSKKDAAAFAKELNSEGTIRKSAYSQKLHDELGNEGFAATHDSPHRFDGKFNWREHSFKGEGAQSFGAGTYLSTANGVHRSYKEAFTRKNLDTKHNEVRWAIQAMGLDPTEPLTERMKRSYENKQKADLLADEKILAEMREEYARHTKAVSDAYDEAMRTGRYEDVPDPPEDWGAWGGARQERVVAQIKRVLEYIQKAPLGQPLTPAAAKSPTYHLSVNAHNHEIMDWDKPFSEQSPHVQMALESLGLGGAAEPEVWHAASDGVGWAIHKNRAGLYDLSYYDPADQQDYHEGTYESFEEAAKASKYSAPEDFKAEEPTEKDGRKMYEALSAKLGGDRAASEALQAAGIVGHRYAAGGGRNDVHPNYVIYDDRRIQTNAVEFSKAGGIPNDSLLNTTDPVKQQELIDAVQKITGQSIGVSFDANQAHEGQYDSAVKMVTLAAMQGFSHSNAFHEAFHAVSQHFLSPEQRKILWKAFRSGAVRQQIRALLKDSPDAWESAKRDPEEMMAYGFQFWHNDMLSLGHEPTSTIGKIFHYLLDKWNKLNDWLRDRPGAQELLKSIKDGYFADGGPSPVEIAAAKAARPNARVREVTKAIFEGLDKLYDTAITPYDTRLRDMGNPHIDDIARRMYTQVGERAGDRGFAQEVPLQTARHLNKLDKMARSNPAAYTQTLNERARGLPQTNVAMHEQVERYLAEIEKYAKDAGVKMGHVENYLPMSWDGDKIGRNRQAFIDMMRNHEMELAAVGFTPEEAADKMAQRNTTTAEFIGPVFDENGAPSANHKLDRVFTFLSNAERAPFVKDDLASSMVRYTQQIVKRSEWARKFGDDNGRWNRLIEKAKEYGLSAEDEDLIKSYKDDAFGVRLHDMNPTIRKVVEANTVYQNYRVLSLSLLSNLIDPFGVAVRSNEWGEAWSSYKLAMERMFKKGRDKHKELQELAETIGSIERAGVQDSLHQRYGGVEVEGNLRKANDALFKFNGMDGLTRSVRLAALAAGTRFIKRHAGLVGEGGTSRHLEELGLRPGDVQVNRFGQLKVLEDHGLTPEVSKRMQAALNRFVDEAAIRPNIGERTKWGANPYLAPLYHLKQYVFSFNKVINKKLEHEFIEHDNPTPYVMASAYIPIMAATAMLRDGLTHGGELPANNGFLHYLNSGIMRSGLAGPSDLMELGVGGGLMGNMNDLRQLAGPTADQGLDFFAAIANPHNTAVFKHFVKESLPGGNIWEHY